MQPEDLTLERARRWRLRVPTTVLTVGPVVVAVLAEASVWNEPGGLSGDIDEVTSWSSFAAMMVVGAGIAAVLLGWFAPRLGAWGVAVAVFPPLVGADLFPNGPTWFMPVAWTWVAVVLLDLVLVLRQREIASWAVRVQASASGRRWQTDRHRGVRLGASVVLTLVVLACAGAFGSWRGDARAFAERAVRTEVEVVTSDTSADFVEAEVDGKRHEFLVNDARDHPVGSMLLVYRDPLGEMRPYSSEDADPDGWSLLGIPAGGALFAFLLVTVEIGRRRRRVEALANSDDHAIRVLVRWHPVHDGLEVFALDDVAGQEPLALLPAIVELHPWSAAAPRGLRGALSDLGRIIRDLVHAPDFDDAMDVLSGAWEDDDPGAVPGTPGPGNLEGLVEATVQGLTCDGNVCVIRTAAWEEVIATVRPARDRWTVRTVVASLSGSSGRGRHKAGRRRSTAVVDRREEALEEEEPSAFLRTVVGLFRRTAVASVPVMLVVGILGLPWFLDGLDPGPGEVVIALVAAQFTNWWWDLGRPRVGTVRDELRLGGRWLDLLVSPGAVTEVRRLAREVVVELGEYGQFEVGEDRSLDDHERGRELDEIVSLIERARGAEAAARPSNDQIARRRRLPSSSALAALLVFAAWITAAFWG